MRTVSSPRYEFIPVAPGPAYVRLAGYWAGGRKLGARVGSRRLAAPGLVAASARPCAGYTFTAGFLGRTRDLRVLGSSKNVLPDFHRVPCRAAGRPEGSPRWPASSRPADAGRAHPIPRGPRPRPALSRVDARAAGGARRSRRSGYRSHDGIRADTGSGADGDPRARAGASTRHRARARRRSRVELGRGGGAGHSTAGHASRRWAQSRAADRRALDDVGGRGRYSLCRRVRGEALHREQPDRAPRTARLRPRGRPRLARVGIDPSPPSRHAISLGGDGRPRAGPLLSLALRGLRLLRSPP